MEIVIVNRSLAAANAINAGNRNSRSNVEDHRAHRIVDDATSARQVKPSDDEQSEMRGGVTTITTMRPSTATIANAIAAQISTAHLEMITTIGPRREGGEGNRVAATHD
ncbi:MAG: hypothetical protein MZV49_21475 [Rhodopseudomonas palustris]|nr:hypothetical protein [Rhodopseudomonas palustris]